MKKKNGITLLALLAVIIILGVLMLVAIPSVTSYIGNSRKEAYLDTIKQIIKGTTNLVNSGELDVYDTETTYYIPSTCIELETGGKSPYGGDFAPAYVLVTYNNESYDYYWMSRDEQGMGIKDPVQSNDLTIDDIISGIKQGEIEPNILIDGKSKVSVFDNDCKTSTVNENVFPGAAGYLMDYLGENDRFSSYPSRFVKIVHENGDIDYRYQGEFPDNSVSFNNELWKIIGVFDGRLKIVRNDPLPNMRWGTGNSDWNNSLIVDYLNNDYLNTISDEYKKMIDNDVTWYLGGTNDANLTKEQMYLEERDSSDVPSYRQFTSKKISIGLIYPSDFGYSAYEGDEYCPKDKLLSMYNETYCKNNCWLSDSSNYTITPAQNYGSHAFFVVNQKLSSSYTTNSYSARPTLYLKKNVKIVSGDGYLTRFVLSYE